jgi:hypothetical protein
MIAWKDYFATPSAPQTAGTIIKWWEVRRLHYNLVVFATIVLISLVLAAFMTSPLSGAYFQFVGAEFGVSFLFLQIPANLWYTGGWVAELLVKRVLRRTAPGFGPWAQAIGMGFSILFVAVIMIWIGYAYRAMGDSQ